MISVASPAMLLSDFAFHLPPELIAQEPVLPRHDARLMVYNRALDTVQHATVRDLPHILPSNSLIVANNSKVRKARLYARFEHKEYEVVILDGVGENIYRCLIGGKGLAISTVLTFYSDTERTNPVPLTATVLGQDISPVMTTYQLQFDSKNLPIEDAFEKYGQIPLPPYIQAKNNSNSHYQTLFAKEIGSAAAPTAGLHFTEELLHELTEVGHTWEEITLHVGLGTFLPLRQEEITSNSLHTEMTYLSPSLSGQLTRAKVQSKSVVAIGTTTTRTLESHYRNGAYVPGALPTNIFIYPGYTFSSVNCLFTNFHLPKSSLLLMVAAFLGNTLQGIVTLTEQEMTQKVQELYAVAIAEQYRFYSYGDAMLIL
jgi:S-adenosylmethionine:tRNA ribosyltransferase-isomerase